MDLKQVSQTIEQYKLITLKDLYSQWTTQEATWRQPGARKLFWDLKHFVDVTLSSSSDKPKRSCYEYDVALIDILNRHLKLVSNPSHLQPAFVALILELLDSKRDDEWGRRPSGLLTHGYKSQLLSFLVAQFLQTPIVDRVIDLYHDVEQKSDLAKHMCTD
jgi:hypothetical protein